MDDKCLEGADHDYEKIGYLVCASERSSAKRPVKNPSSGNPSNQPMIWGPGTAIGIAHYWSIPVFLTADIEVLQCQRCGNVKFMPAVFDKILGGDKECQE